MDIDAILKKIQIYQPEKVFLFGSLARDEGDEYSDLDLVIIKDTEKRFVERLIEVARIVGVEFGKVDILVYTPEEFKKMEEMGNPFIEQVLKEGRVIHEKE